MKRGIAGFVPQSHTFFAHTFLSHPSRFLADNFLQVCALGRFLRYPSSAIHGRERAMPGEIDDRDTYYRKLAERCRISASGFLAINPELADLYLTAADVWDRMRFTRR